MPPSQKSHRSNRSKHNGTTKKNHVVPQEPRFATSRVGGIEDDGEQFISPLDESITEDDLPIEDAAELSSEDERTVAAQSYASLLKTLRPTKTTSERSVKRRKLNTYIGVDGKENGEPTEDQNGKASEVEMQQDADVIDDANDIEQTDEAIDSDDENLATRDPFEQRFADFPEAELVKIIESQSQKPSLQKNVLGKGVRKVTLSGGVSVQDTARPKSQNDMRLKSRLKSGGDDVLKTLAAEELDLALEMFAYHDVLCGFRSPSNSEHIRNLTSLHILNHILKTRDRVLKNNAKLAQDPTSEGEYRDQGFTRPKALVLLPTKQSCVTWVESLVKLSEPDQQENKSRFLDQYSLPNDNSFDDRPEDFKELFTGNHEEDFRMGLKFTRKTIKFFSGFYNSDVIFASPLGLMRTIKSGGSSSGFKEESKKGHDADFLSSIEICVVDQATALEQQNWSHIDYIFSQLNQVPRESHGCDFARVRHFYLNDQSKYLRQVLVFASYITPSMQSLATTHMHNISDRVRYTPTYPGAMLDLSPTIPMSITQTFLRFESPSLHNDNDARFKYFTTTILSHLLRNPSKSSHRGTLIFVPTYLDFVRLRNHFATAAETTALSFGTISEYSSRGEVARTRAHFLSGKHSVVLYTERSHHYFRYKLKGVRRLIFYGLPENPIFWTELIAMLGMNAMSDLEWAQSLRGNQGRGLVRAVFSKWDYMKLERVVGTERVARLVRDTQGDVFEFV